MNILFYFTIFKHLLHAEFIEFRKGFLDKMIDLSIVVFCSIVVMGYLVATQFNIGSAFGSFTLAGALASQGLWQVYPRVAGLIMDFDGEKHIAYQLMLPFPSWFIFIKLITYYTLSSIATNIFILPMGKLLLWNSFNLANINWIQFAFIFVLSNIFYAAFTLWVTSLTKDMSQMERVWIRFNFPLWFLGCSQNSWAAFHNLMPTIAYLNLCNPIVYIMEGTRAALLGQAGYLPFWHSCAALVGFTVLFAWLGINRLKKRLDFV